MAFWPLHWLSWLLSSIGIVSILLAHDHYTVDIVVAYLIATRLFWTYHVMASANVSDDVCIIIYVKLSSTKYIFQSLKIQSKSNHWSKVWWFRIFKYFEENIRCNGCLPADYEWPLPWPIRMKYSVIRRSPIKGV